MLLVPPAAAASSNVVFLCNIWYFALDLRDFHFNILCSSLPALAYGNSRAAYVDHEPALLVLYCLTHHLRGWGIVYKRRADTVDRVARYQTD